MARRRASLINDHWIQLQLRPQRHPFRDEALIESSHLLVDHAMDENNIELLHSALQFAREALVLRPPGHPARAESLDAVSSCLQYRYTWFGDEADMVECLQLAREAVSISLSSPQSPSRVRFLITLASALTKDAAKQGDYKILDEAIDIARSAVGLSLDDRDWRLRALNVLSYALAKHQAMAGHDESLGQAIELASKALDMCPAGHSFRHHLLHTLALATSLKFARTGDITLSESCISLARQVLQERPPHHRDRDEALLRLSMYLRNHCRFVDNKNAKKESLYLCREVLRIRGTTHPESHSPFFLLSIMLNEWEHRTSGDVIVLDEAVKCMEEALRLLPAKHSLRSVYLYHLMLLLQAQYDHLADPQKPHQILSLSQEILRICDTHNPHYIPSLAGQGLAYLSLYKELKDASLLDMACSTLEEAFTICPEDYRSFRFTIHLDLASACLERFKLSQQQSDITRSIQLLRRLGEMEGLDSEYGRRSRMTLAHALQSRARAAEQRDEVALSEATSILQHLEKVFETGHPKRHEVLTSLAQVELENGQHNRFSLAVMHVLQIINDVYAPPKSRLTECIGLLSKAQARYFQYESQTAEHRDALLKAYQDAIELLPLVANPSLDLASRLRELGKAQAIGLDGASFATIHDLGPVAFEVLEESRGMFWSQSLQMRHTQFDQLLPLEAEELADLFQALSQSKKGSYTDEMLMQRRKQSERARSLLQDIRRRPDLERFMRCQPFSLLARAAKNGPLVALTASQYQCNALVLLNDVGDWLRVRLPKVTTDILAELTIRAREFGFQRGENRLMMSRKQKQTGDAKDHFSLLWKFVVNPIFDALKLQRSTGRARPRLHWCPTGSFALVPVHAAGIYKGGAVQPDVGVSDFVVSSYTPTLSALIKDRDEWRSMSRDTLKVLVATEHSAPGFYPIPHVEREGTTVLETIRSISPNIHVKSIGLDDDEGALKQHVTAALMDANVVHFACHGQQHPQEPLDSGFQFRDGPLTLAELMGLKLPNALVAFLSACETAQGDKNNPDQAVHLAAAMLFTGFKSVVATMW
jgi:hypothetical protein